MAGIILGDGGILRGVESWCGGVDGGGVFVILSIGTGVLYEWSEAGCVGDEVGDCRRAIRRSVVGG